jgi:hypothetical protein
MDSLPLVLPCKIQNSTYKYIHIQTGYIALNVLQYLSIIGKIPKALTVYQFLLKLFCLIYMGVCLVELGRGEWKVYVKLKLHFLF